MALKIIGKVFSIGTLQTISSKNGGQPFTKRELIIDATRFDGLTGERGFDNYPAFEFSGDKCAELDRLTTGQVVEVSFELQGSFYKDSSGVDRNFTRIRAYKVEPYVMKKPQPKPQVTNQQPMPSDYPPPPSDELPWRQ